MCINLIYLFIFYQVLFPRLTMYTHLCNLLFGTLYVVDGC